MKCWNMESLEVCGNDLKLRSLIVDKCMFLWGFLIEAPNLKYFKYAGTVATFDFNKTTGVEEADLDFGLESECDEDRGNLLYQLLHEVNPKRALTICSYVLQVLN